MALLLGPILRKALTHSALMTAWEKVKDNNGMAGIDGETVENTAHNIRPIIQELRQSVIQNMYQPKPLLRL